MTSNSVQWNIKYKKYWERLEFTKTLTLLFTTETWSWLNISGWEGGSQLRCKEIYEYLICEIGRKLWNKKSEFKMTRGHLYYFTENCKRQNHFWGIICFVSEGKLKNFYQHLWKIPKVSFKNDQHWYPKNWEIETYQNQW